MPVVSPPPAPLSMTISNVNLNNPLLGPIPGTTVPDNSGAVVGQNGTITIPPFTTSGSPATAANGVTNWMTIIPTPSQQVVNPEGSPTSPAPTPPPASSTVVNPEGGPTSPTPAPAASTPTQQTPAQASPQVIDPGTIDGPPVGPSSITTTPAPLDTTLPQVSLSDFSSLSALLAGVTQPNCLNSFYNPTYHFRLFVAGDADILEQVGNQMSAISSQQINQVTIAESGVTGVSIKEVEIFTRPAQNPGPKAQMVTNLEMTIIDPLGMTFLDGLVDAGRVMGLSDYTKAPYLLELSFKGYDDQGNAISPSQLPNNGIWIWSVTISNINTTINEGGGLFKLTAVVLGHQNISSAKAASGNSNEEQRLPSQSLTVSGTTVKDMFQDFTTKINAAWKNSTGGALVTLAGIVTHPVVLGPPTAVGVDPGTFTLKAQAPFQSSQRTWQFDTSGDGRVTCHVPPNASVSEFITAVIQSTEQGQMLMTDVPIVNQVDLSQTQVNARNFRNSVMFSVETDIINTNFDTNTNNYMKQVTFHVVGHSNMNIILSQTQLAQASTPAVQNSMLQTMITNKLIQKRYDYIYTGLNTEVLNFEINWDMSWTTILPKLWGTRTGYNNASVNGVLNKGNVLPQGTRYQASGELDVDPNTINAVTSGQTANSTQTATPVGTPTATAGPTIASPPSMTTAGPNVTPLSTTTTSTLQSGNLSSLLQSQSAISLSTIAPGIAATTSLLSGGATSPQVAGGNMKFIEDYEDSVTLGTALPTSFKYGNNNVSQNSGTSAMSGQFHRGQSITGAIFAQVYGSDAFDFQKLMQMELTIRGDPFWLGQTNLDRMMVNRQGGPTYDPTALPDYVSSPLYVYIHFQYPLTVGDDFVPVLSPSDSFNGIYYVTGVKHSFVDGGFKQTLELVKNTMFVDNSHINLPGQPATAPNLPQNIAAQGGSSV